MRKEWNGSFGLRQIVQAKLDAMTVGFEERDGIARTKTDAVALRGTHALRERSELASISL